MLRVLRAVPAVALLAGAGACWIPDPPRLDDKPCDDAHSCVRVTRAVLHVREDGSIQAVPETPEPVELLVETAGGDFVSLPPAVEDAGVVAFWDAPQGPYLLRFGSRYFESDAGAVDLSELQLGRPDLESPTPGTALRSQLDCLASWAPGDEIQLTAAGAGLGGLDIAQLGGWTPPATGLTQLNAGVSWAPPLTPGIINTSLGDQPIYTQLEHDLFIQMLPDGRRVSGDEWLATRFAAPASLDMACGMETTVARSCMNSPPIRAWTKTQVRGAAFGNLLAEMGPGAKLTGITVTMGHAIWPGGPGPELSRTTWATPDDLLVTTQELGGAPFPASWPKEMSAVMTASVPVTLKLDGGTTTASEQATLATRRPHPVSGGELAPALGPPRSVLVNGEVAAIGMTGANPQPEITWTEPALGTPTAYEVTVWREQDPARRRAPRLEGSIWTERPRVRLPPGLLVPGATYVLRVRAVAGPIDVRRAPLRAGLPEDEATTVTGLIEP